MPNISPSAMITKRLVKRLLFLAFAAIFFFPVVDEALSEASDPTTIITKLILATVRMAAALLLVGVLGWMNRRVRKTALQSRHKLDLPASAFQVRISMIRMNVLSALLTVIALAACAIAYRFVWGSIDSPSFWVLAYLVLLIVLHELSHALGWILRGIPIRSIKFGVMWHLLAPYAHCRIPMSMGAYRFGMILPLFTTGFLPLGIGLWIQSFSLTLASALLIGGAAGDLSMMLASIAFHPRTRVMDHPSEPAFVILDKGNLPIASESTAHGAHP